MGPQQFYLNAVQKNYIHTAASELRSKQMAEQLEMSPQDKHKAKFGEANQAQYLIMAKENIRKQRQLFDDREISEEYKEKSAVKSR